MKYLSMIFAVILLTACGGGDSKPAPEPVPEVKPLVYTLVATPTGYQTSWYELPNQEYGNGVPKYVGPFGTYTYKHIPVSIWSGGHHFSTFSDNHSGNLEIFLTKDLEPPVLVHVQENWIDTHMNAVVNVDPEGYVWVHVSARNTRRPGAVYKSEVPYGTEMELIENNQESYPQVHNAAWGYTTLSNRYEYPVGGGVHRTLHFRGAGKSIKLVEGGHYQISYYDEDTTSLYSVYNYHPHGKTDRRTNLFVMKTVDGMEWTNLDGKVLNLPMEENSPLTRILEVEGLGKYIYLKDVYIDSKGAFRVLYVASSSYDPTIGIRIIKEYVNGKTRVIEETGHNYNSAAYLEDSTGLYMVTAGKGDVPGYSGGPLSLYRENDEGVWELKHTLDDNLNYSYFRRVRDGGLKGVVSVGSSEADLGSEQYNVEVIIK